MQLTPFGRLVRKHRIDRDMLLGDMADALGVSSAYLSSVETGKKGAPKADLVNRVAEHLKLSTTERAELHQAAEESSKIIRLEVPKNNRGSDVVAAFARQFSELSDEQFAAIRSALEEKIQ